MKQISNSSLQAVDDQHSNFWEIPIPIAAAAVPATLFWLLGLITPLLGKQGDDAPGWVVASMICLELIGFVAMAVVLLIRYDIASQRLLVYANGNPSAWRRATLALSIAMLILFDTTVNLAAAFAGGAVLLVLSIPAFIAYVALGRLSLLGLEPATKSAEQPY